MVEITGIYEGKKHCRMTHEPSKSVIHSDAPVDHDGMGEAFSPTDLVAAALGCCMLTVMGIYADKNNLDIKGSTVRVLKEMNTSPRRIASLTVELTLPSYLNETERKTLENVSKTCPVKYSLHPDILIPVTFSYKDIK
jgi:putative redox protein